MKLLPGICVIATVCMAMQAHADITTTLDATQTLHSTLLTFDEAGGPTGNVGTGDFSSFGIASLDAGDANPVVGDFSADPQGGPWLGSDNSFFGNFGVFLQFAGDVDAFSANVYDPSGPPSPFGGGAAVFIFDDGAEVSNFFFEPSWGGLGDDWLNIQATNGMVFDEVRILGFGFPATTFVDDLSFNQVPEPTAALILGVTGLFGLVRRR